MTHSDHHDTATVSSPPHTRLPIFFCALFVAAMIACVALPRAQSFIPGLFGVAGMLALYFKDARMLRTDKGLLFAFCAIIALCGISAAWSPDASFTLEKTGKTAAILFSGFALLSAAAAMPPLPPLTRDRIVLAGGCGFIVAALLVCLEYSAGFPLTRFFMGYATQPYPESIRNGFALNRGIVFLTLLSLPFFYGVVVSTLPRATKNALCAAMVFSVIAALWHSTSQTAQMTAAIIALMALYPLHRKKARAFVVGVALSLFIVAPLLPGPAFTAFATAAANAPEDGFIREASIAHRLEVWDFIAGKISQSPLIGHGMEATRFLKADHVMTYMQKDTVLHPHNAVLQVWVEFGAVGILAACLFLLFLSARIEAMAPRESRFFMLYLVATLSVMATGYGLWQGWQLGMVMAMPALAMLFQKPNAIKAL